MQYANFIVNSKKNIFLKNLNLIMTFQSVLKSIAILMILGGVGIIWFGLNMIK